MRHLPFLRKAEEAAGAFTLTERTVFKGAIILAALAAIIMLLMINNTFLVEVPAAGGEIVEGIVGTPRFINPVLALNDAEKDLVSLLYSGLMKATPEGSLSTDLAEKYEISPDNLTYTFTIKKNAVFHDGTPVIASDVVFTIEKAKDPALKSPRRAAWEGVSVQSDGERVVRFTLNQPYAPFLENTTIGILPAHIWKNVGAEEFQFSEWNVEPIGSGPYRIGSVKTDAGRMPKEYQLKSFSKYALGEPLLSYITLKFYQNEEDLLKALRAGDIQSVSGISPSESRILEDKGFRVERASLPRIFAVFFNQNQNAIFTFPEVKAALNQSADRERIVKEVLNGFGAVIESPLPPGALDKKDKGQEDSAEFASTSITRAKKTLADAGWTTNPETGILEKKTGKQTLALSFSLSTANAPELKKSAEILKEIWTKVGANVEIKSFETGDLNQIAIRPRKFDSLLFGEIVGRDLDLFAFWHSSQRNDPGLNVAMYANSKADKILEEARQTTDRKKILSLYESFAKIISADMPAVFLYSPDFIYVVPKNLRGISLGEITIGSERFLNIHKWYMKSDYIWRVFEDAAKREI